MKQENRDLKERILRELEACHRKPVSAKQLAARLRLKKGEVAQFTGLLAELRRSGEIFEDHHRLMLASRMGLLRAQVVKATDRFAFARVQGQEQDIFIPGRLLMGAMSGDEVLLRPKQQRGELPEAEVVRILTRTDAPFSGVVRFEHGRAYVVPDSDTRISYEVLRSSTVPAGEGEKVLARVYSRGSRQSAHKVKILQAFGSAQRADVCAEAILAARALPTAFPEPVLAEAQDVSSRGIHEKELAARLDLRSETIFTIDGADTKDIDDAVSLRRTEHGWELGVHIADVSYYVLPGSELDREAFERGTSVYYADRVLPMLPPALSNGICSLNPQEDRLAFSCLMQLSPEGEMQDYRFEKTVIRSRVKGVYSEVNALLEGSAGPDVRQKYTGLEKTLFDMRELAGRLQQRRRARGAIDLQSVESKIIIAPDGSVQDIRPRVQGVSEALIEEFMLLANQAAASFGLREKLPFLFRIHETPGSQKIEALHDLLESLGIECRAIRPGVSQAQLSAVLESVRGTPLYRIVNEQILRAMAKARYSEENVGHYGLVMENYSHFTSPIRRYPDLAIHRIMSARLGGMRRENLERRYRAFSVEAAARSSERELRAVQVERDCEDCYKAEYMLGHLGECFEGVVSSVAQHGLYVELPNTVEGLLRLTALPAGDYEVQPGVSVTERFSGKRYRVGDAITIQVAGANVSAGQVDFVLPEH